MGKTPTFKEIVFGGGPKICRQASSSACGDAKLQHLRDLQPIDLLEKQCRAMVQLLRNPAFLIAVGGGGGGPIKQVLGLGFRVSGF